MHAPMLTRRRFCKLVAAAAALVPFGGAMAAIAPNRKIRLVNVHTNERLELAYCKRGVYNPGALEELDHFLRCHYTGEVVEMDIKVIDIVSDIQRAAGRPRPAEVISGYRSPEYNQLLRRQGSGVAEHSFHMKGQAIDFLIPGVPNRRLARLARLSSAGGVGIYSKFIHVDSGPVRSW